MNVTFVIVNYHGLSDTLACLDSLQKTESVHDWNVVVVNVEDDKEAIRIGTHKLGVEVIHLDENLGYSGANNAGIKQALKHGAEIIVLLNNDTTVDANMLDPLVNTSLESDVGMVSPKIYFSAGREFHSDEYSDSERGRVIWYAGGVIDWKNVYAFHWGVNEVDHEQFNESYETDFATGCCLAIRADVIEKVGLLDEGYFLYLEDVDWSVRVKKNKYRILFEPKSVVWHKNAGSTGGSGSDIHQFHQSRSRLRFARKHASWRSKLAVYREYLKNNRDNRSPELLSDTEPLKGIGE